MRAASAALALALIVAVPIVATRPQEYPYVISAERTAEGDYLFEAGGMFPIGGTPRERTYLVTIDAESKTVASIEPIKENNKGYVAELSLFIGKTRHEIAVLSGKALTTDSEFSATYTNTELRDTLLQCFDYITERMGGNANG